jgi:Fe2+ transport system protein B
LDEDFDVISVPLPLAVTERRIQEASDIVRYLQNEVGQSTTSKIPSDRLLEDLEGLKARARALAALLDTDDSLSREEARRDYETQYANAKQSRRAWTQTMLGNSFVSQLKMLANPSDAEIRSMIEGAQDFLEPRVLPLTQMAGKFILQTLIGTVILVVALYFFFADGNSMIETLMRLSPLDDAYERKLLMQFDQTSRAVVLASVLSALAQGVLAALGFWAVGMPSIILLFMATTFMALVPFLGAASVWVPCAIYLATVEQRIGAAIGLAIFGAAVISSIDNVIKVFVLQGRSQIHPLLALAERAGGAASVRTNRDPCWPDGRGFPANAA